MLTSSVKQIEEENILNASLDAMKRACNDVVKQFAPGAKSYENEGKKCFQMVEDIQ